MIKPPLAAILALVALAALPAVADAAKPKPYYVALGDSLAVGVQPKASGKSVNTSAGYPNQLAKRVGGLRLVNLGCGGASTESVLKGNKRCGPKRRTPYANTSPSTSQVAYAERFLRKNRKNVKFVTIDIGANDVVSCADGGSIDLECVNKGIATIKKNARTIAKRLRKAGGKNMPMAIMTIYNPFLQQWFNGSGGKKIAKLSQDLARTQVNAELIKAFRPSGFKIARVAEAFNTYDRFSTDGPSTGTPPLPVRKICSLTWMCADEPRGPNIHANKKGYGVIAGQFRKALGRAAR